MLERLIRLEEYLAQTLQIPTEDFAVTIPRFKAGAEFHETEQFVLEAPQGLVPAASQHDFKIRRDYILTVHCKNQLKPDNVVDNLLAWLQSEGLNAELTGMLERNNQASFDLFIDLELVELSRNTPTGRVVTC
jgi:hypothetical protein